MGVVPPGSLSIGQVEERSGIAVTALRFYESKGLISSTRTDGGQRRFARETLRRLAFIRVAQRVGLTLEEIRDALDGLPGGRTPTPADWDRLVSQWRAELDERIRLLHALAEDLSGCIGCGCLSFDSSAFFNPDDGAAALGTGPRYLLGDSSADVVG